MKYEWNIKSVDYLFMCLFDFNGHMDIDKENNEEDKYCKKKDIL